MATDAAATARDPRRYAVLGLALAAVLVRLTFLRAHLGTDEAGLLLVAAQWAPGDSLYGDYWVDRPPLLLAVFSLAHLLGGELALRLLGCAAAAASVLLAASVGRVVAGPVAAPWSALVTAGMVSTPLFASDEVVAELLAVPFVLAGVLGLLRARSDQGRRVPLLAAAGAAGAAAFLIKQSFADVFVAAAVMLVVDRVSARPYGDRHSVLGTVGLFVAGAVAVVTTCLAGAALRGTSIAGLWDAVVVFRIEAIVVIADSASSATTERLARFPAALLASGAGLVIVAFAVRCALFQVDRVAWFAAGLLAWEGIAVLAGGGFWMHYLVGLVPGVCMALAVVLVPAPRRRAEPDRRDLAVLMAKVSAVWALVSALVLVPVTHIEDHHTVSTTVGASAWLERNRLAGDTAIVAYGQASILAESGTTSPYSQLWSLPMRIRDPDLRELEGVLRGGSAPVWVLVRRDWDAWGIDPTRVARIVERDYRPVGKVCGYLIFLRDGVERTHADKTSCRAWSRRA